jgi:hypothetical protein
MFALSILFMCATFLPLLYSVLLPNDDLERFVNALKYGGTAPLDADAVVEQTKAAVGSLTKAIQVAYYTGGTVRVNLTGPQHPEQMKVVQATYIAWFEKQPKPMLVAITMYLGDAGQKTYGISQANGASILRGYAVPLVLFAVSLFLVRKRKPPAGVI